jgi:hypothetical protein
MDFAARLDVALRILTDGSAENDTLSGIDFPPIGSGHGSNAII